MKRHISNIKIYFLNKFFSNRHSVESENSIPLKNIILKIELPYDIAIPLLGI